MIAYIIFGVVTVAVLALAGNIIVGSIKVTKLNRDIFNKGTRKQGTVVAYTDYANNVYLDANKDCIYNGGSSTESSYTSVILAVMGSNGNTEEVTVDSYGTENGEDVMLSVRFPIGAVVDFYELNGNRRFATDKWLAK